MIVDGIKIKTIPGFPDYAISRYGRIFSFQRKYTTHTGKWIKSFSRKSGHLGIRLWRGGIGCSRLIHRLVLETYIGPKPVGKECRHLDGNPANNKLDNLCWGTRTDNERDKKRHGRDNAGERHGHSKLKEQDVRMIIYMYHTGLFLQKEIANIYDVATSIICKIVTKKIWKYVWNI